MTGVAALHDSLCQIQTGTGEISPARDINNSAHRPTVDAHAQAQLRMILERATNLCGTTNGRLRTCVKDQRHAVARWDLNQAISRLGFLKLVRRANDLCQFIDGCVLLINGKRRIANDVDEQNMPDLQLNFFFRRRPSPFQPARSNVAAVLPDPVCQGAP